MYHLGLFAKYWEAGKVKTRLAKDLGELGAMKVYFAFLNHLVSQLGKCGDLRTIGFSPAESNSEFETLAGESWALVPQSTRDLGHRMAHFFEWAFSENKKHQSNSASCVVLIGSDTPHISSSRIEEAFAILNDHDVVIGPSTDGGYYLVGMSGRVHPIFEGIEWSTETVLPDTLELMRRNGISYGLLEPMTDIDFCEDLLSLMERIHDQPEQFEKAETALRENLEAILQANPNFETALPYLNQDMNS